MSFHRHHTIVVTGWDQHSVEEAHAEALRIFGDIGEPLEPRRTTLVSSITPPQVNGYSSFFVAPDGSKEGWEPSVAGDAARAKFTAYLTSSRDRLKHIDYVEVAFGGSVGEATIISDSGGE
jgi:hypothetical protein